MKKLFLSSSFEDAAGKLADFAPDLRGKTVTFIPTASVVEEVTFYVKTGKSALEDLGLIVDELELSTACADTIQTKLRKNDAIYVSGGNSFFLLQELKRTGADALIREEVAAGKLYIGESAGSIITAPDIEYVREMDSVEAAPHLADFSALGLTDFYTVPHYNSFPFEEAAQEIVDRYDSSLPLMPISNQEAILVDGVEVRIDRR